MKFIITIIFSIVCMKAWTENEFDINSFSDPLKYGWENSDIRNNARKDLFERQKLLQLYNLNKKTVTNTLFKTAILPGWGHFETNHNTKGQIFLAMEITLMSSSLYFFDKAKDYHKKYESATQVDQMNYYYDKATTPYRYSQVFLGLYFVVWAYSMYDNVISTDNYNDELWKDISKKYYQKKFQITPGGISWRF